MDWSSTVAATLVSGALLFSGGVARETAKREWVRIHHAVVPDGSSEMQFGGTPALILSMVGQRARMEVQDGYGVGAFHVLLLFAGDSIHTVMGTTTSGGLTGSITQEMELWSGGEMVSRRAFHADYDAVGRRAHIRGQTFALTRGNLFVVRYDARGRSSVIQLPRTILSNDADRLVQEYRSYMPADPILRDLYHYPPPPSPSAPTEAAGAKT